VCRKSSHALGPPRWASLLMAAAKRPAAGPSQRRTTPYGRRMAITVSITCGSRIDHVKKPKTRADNASTMKAPGSLSSVIDAAGSYPAYKNGRQLSDMLFTAGAQ
jgi:hypothetical protein